MGSGNHTPSSNNRETFLGAVAEPCSGDGAMVEVLRDYGYEVIASDLREIGVVGAGGVNLFDLDHATNTVTNPPYTDFGNIVEHFVTITERKVACLLPLRFLGSKERRPFLISNPPARVYVLPRRPVFHVGGRDGRKTVASHDYGWFVWDRSHAGPTEMITE